MYIAIYHQYYADVYYIGSVNTNGMPHGIGIMCIGQNMIYRGEFQNYLFHGKGKLEYKHIEEEHIFEGEFENGLPHGQIIETIPRLGIRECRFLYGHADGFGITRYNQGKVHKGFIKNNMYDGFGVMYNSDGSVFYEGEWNNSKRNGKGISYQNGIKYEGEWKDDMPDGRGMLTNSKGVTFDGFFDNGDIVACFSSNSNSIIDDEDLDTSG